MTTAAADNASMFATRREQYDTWQRNITIHQIERDIITALADRDVDRLRELVDQLEEVAP